MKKILLSGLFIQDLLYNKKKKEIFGKTLEKEIKSNAFIYITSLSALHLLQLYDARKKEDEIWENLKTLTENILNIGREELEIYLSLRKQFGEQDILMDMSAAIRNGINIIFHTEKLMFSQKMVNITVPQK